MVNGYGCCEDIDYRWFEIRDGGSSSGRCCTLVDGGGEAVWNVGAVFWFCARAGGEGGGRRLMLFWVVAARR